MRKKRELIGSKFYFVWAQIKQRCNNPANVSYKNYGGRGITYDPNWELFEQFKHDMFPSFKEGLSIDRIDVNKNYSKTNCRWVTRQDQNRNMRRVPQRLYKNKICTLGEIAITEKLPYDTLWRKVNRKGFTVEEAVKHTREFRKKYNRS